MGVFMNTNTDIYKKYAPIKERDIRQLDSYVELAAGINLVQIISNLQNHLQNHFKSTKSL